MKRLNKKNNVNIVNKNIKKIALVAGGTGGHIFPAVSLAKWIKVNRRDTDVIFFSGNRQLEKEIYNTAEFAPIVLPMQGSPLSGNLSTKLKRLCNLIRSFFTSNGYLREEKPDFVLFFGGYISFPVYLAAKLRSIPVALHEQNACAGKVTRLFARFGEKIFSGFKVCLPLEADKVTYTGIPTRKFDLLPKEVALEELALPKELSKGKIVLVLTGSLGSETIKDAILSLPSDKNFAGINFILPATSDKTKQVGKNIWLLPRIWKTELLFSLADAIIARAGASSLAEISDLAIPAIVIPWKGAKDNHQYFNAREFVKDNNAIFLDEDDIAKNLAQKLQDIFSRAKTSATTEDASNKIFTEIENSLNK